MVEAAERKKKLGQVRRAEMADVKRDVAVAGIGVGMEGRRSKGWVWLVCSVSSQATVLSTW